MQAKTEIDNFADKMRIIVRDACLAADLQQEDLWRVMSECGKIVRNDYKNIHYSLNKAGRL